MPGYTINFASNPGDRIDAELFQTEFSLLSAAFDNSTGHNHDGITANGGAFIPLISDPLALSSVTINSTNNSIDLAVNNLGVKTEQLSLSHGVLTPINSLDLGTTTNLFKDGYFSGNIQTNSITLSTGSSMSAVLDENDMVSDSFTALATQRSIKAYVDNNLSALIGIFTQSQFVRRSSDLSLTGAFADYLLLSITVQEGSYVHVHGQVQGQCANLAGSILGRIHRDLTPLGAENFYVTNVAIPNLFGSTSFVEKDGPLTAGTYTYSIKLRESLTDGLATSASLLLLEETV